VHCKTAAGARRRRIPESVGFKRCSTSRAAILDWIDRSIRPSRNTKPPAAVVLSKTIPVGYRWRRREARGRRSSGAPPRARKTGPTLAVYGSPAGTFPISYVKDRHVEAVKKGGLRLDRDETPGVARDRGRPAPGIAELYDIPIELMAKILQAAGATEPSRLATRHSRRYQLARMRSQISGRRRDPGDRWTGDRDRLFDEDGQCEQFAENATCATRSGATGTDSDRVGNARSRSLRRIPRAGDRAARGPSHASVTDHGFAQR